MRGYLLTHYDGGICLRTTTGAENKQAHNQPIPEGAGGTKRLKTSTTSPVHGDERWDF